MEKLSIDEMKQVELELMSELDRVCRENNLSYVLAYGSCLGAVRHKGFIPWDDDMDVAMPRADYERLIDSFDQLKSKPHYELVSYRKDKAIYPFLKLIDTSTHVLENFADKRFSTGVWVDIFPLDKVDPTDSVVFKRNKRLALVRSLIVADPHVGSGLFVKVVKRLTHPFASRMNPYDYARRIDENAAGASFEGCETLADIVGEGKPDQCFSQSIFEPKEAIFEGHTFFVPTGYEAYLTALYGDWRTPLPVSEREVHACEAYLL